MITDMQINFGYKPDYGYEAETKAQPFKVRLLLKAGTNTVAIFSRNIFTDDTRRIRQDLVAFGFPPAGPGHVYSDGAIFDMIDYERTLTVAMATASSHMLLRILQDPRVERLEANGRWLRGQDRPALLWRA